MATVVGTNGKPLLTAANFEDDGEQITIVPAGTAPAPSLKGYTCDTVRAVPPPSTAVPICASAATCWGSDSRLLRVNTQAMQATLSMRVVCNDTWGSRLSYFVNSEPLGNVDTAAAALVQMGAVHGQAGATANIHELDVDGTFQTRNGRLRLVRETMFSPKATLGYGNLWTTAIRSRGSLVQALTGPLCVATGAGGAKLSGSVAAADVKAIECLRGLLGEPRMLPALGVLNKSGGCEDHME